MSESDTCPVCGGALVEADEIVSGWNGALSDVGTDRIILMCEICGEVVAP